MQRSYLEASSGRGIPPTKPMPEIRSTAPDGEMLWSVTNALILALDWLETGPEACDLLQSAVEALEGSSC